MGLSELEEGGNKMALKTAIIGCGGIANSHATNLMKLGKTDLVAFCDVAPERASGYNEKYANGEAKIFTDFSKMYDEIELDLVYICLPPFAHANEVELAAEHGVNVFIEKPIALTMQKANEMVESVGKAGVKSQVGFMSRFGDAVVKVKEMVDSNEAGPIGLMVGKYMCNSLHSPWWREKSKSGGQIVEQIIHTYDVIRYFMGEAESVYCSSDNIFHKGVERYTSEDVSGTVITFKGGAIATVSGANGAIPGQWLSQYELVAKNITVNFASANYATLFKTDVSPAKKIEIRGDTDNMLAETLDLISAVETDGETRIPMIEGAKSLELVLAASKSGETDKIIEF